MKIIVPPLIPIVAAALAFGAGAAPQPVLAASQVGVQVAVNQDATATNPGASPRRIVIGQEVVHDERIDTDAAGQTQVLFLDESSMSVGPNSDLVVDSFVYDPQAGAGRLAMSATRGVFRYVGGRLSKLEGAVTISTPAAAIGIRGGIMLMELTSQGGLAAIFAYGRALSVTGREGTTQTITRPGWEVTVAGPGAAPSQPFPAAPGTAARLLALLDGLPGRHGGARTMPALPNALPMPGCRRFPPVRRTISGRRRCRRSMSSRRGLSAGADRPRADLAAGYRTRRSPG